MSSVCDERCEGCEHCTPIPSFGLVACYYYIHTGIGHRRGCKAGTECDKYEPYTGKYDVPEPLPIIKKPDRNRMFKALYDKGMSDLEIATEAKVSSSAVRNWRWRYKLPANYTQSSIVPIDCARIRECYQKGMNDVEIADAVGCSPKTIGRWRKKNGLERNYKRGSGKE